MGELPFWNSDALSSHPVFEAVAPLVKELGVSHPKNSLFLKENPQKSLGLPTLEALQLHLDKSLSRPRSGCGIPIRILEQKTTQRRSRVDSADQGWSGNYQIRLYLAGELFTRAQCYHDLFNLFVHVQFPLSKARLNARHFFCLDEKGPFPWKTKPGQNRCAEQDLLTHVDEGGVIVVTESLELLNLLKARKWHELFYEKRSEVLSKMKFFVFGHALYEDVLKGHVTPHGLGVPLLAPAGIFKMELKEQLLWADENFAKVIEKRNSFNAVSQCFPVPLLGYPGWSADNDKESYYRNEVYFR
jgi:hypothetical protein